MVRFSLTSAPDTRTGRPGQKCLVLGHRADTVLGVIVPAGSDNSRVALHWWGERADMLA